ncbi:MAG TPA: helix-turn-helix domain-containing protein [Candidatus Marinimicrobia bacterium]|jgi:transcriptional regulator with XRE-family HTH domain|nr:helix-turn-helix domain-containing protein [Candidatus Neomarinimicrobiota bacterium]
MSDLHKKLKALRREQKIDLAEIEKRTKINLEFLKAIESGKFEVLPSTYIRLFLKAYCIEIGADPVDALRQMNILLGDEEPEALPIAAEEIPVEENGESDEGTETIAMDHPPHEMRSDWVKGAAMIILLIFSIYIIKQIVSEQPPQVSGNNAVVESTVEPITDIELINDFVIDKTNTGSLDVDPPYLAKIVSRKAQVWFRTETDSALPIENILHNGQQDNFRFVERFDILINPTTNVDLYWSGQLVPYLESTPHPAKITLDGSAKTVTVQHYVPQN